MSKRGRGETCYWCTRTLESMGSRSGVAATRDHVVPQCQGGTHTVWCCWTCNVIKGNMTPYHWRGFMRDNPRWWTNGPRPFRGARRPSIGPRLNLTATRDEIMAVAKRLADESFGPLTLVP